MASDNERNTVLKNHAIELDKVVKGLKYEQDCLESGNRSMKTKRKRMLTQKEKLINETNEIKKTIRQRMDTIAQLEIRIDSLKRIKAGLDIDTGQTQAEEVSNLSEPVSVLNIQSWKTITSRASESWPVLTGITCKASAVLAR